MECDKPLPLTEFDRVTVSESTQMIKAVIPFLDASTKQTISVFIRFQELMQTIEFFKKPFHTESTSSFNRSNYTMQDILYVVMPYLSKSNEDTFNMFQNFMEMFNVINMYKDMDQSEDFQSIINMVKNMNDSNNSDTSDNTGTETDNNSSNNDDKMSSDKNSNMNSNINNMLNSFMNRNKNSNSSNNSDSNNNSNSNNNKSNDTDRNKNKNTDTVNPYSNLMSEDQKKLYDKYLNEIDNINFDNYKEK